MKYSAILIFICGCSRISSNAVIDGAGKDSLGPVEVYSQMCGNEKIKLFSKGSLFSKGGAYFFLFIPIGRAGYLDHGPTFVVDYGTNRGICSVTDVGIRSGKESLNPDSTKPVNESSCSYTWRKAPKSKSELTVLITKENVCDIPPINIKYQYEQEYKYDKLSG